jgi:hypothetical protein
MARNENNAPDSFPDYADAFRRQLNPAIVVPLVDTHPPDDVNDGAFLGTVGAFVAGLPAIVVPNGPWYPDYQGIVPVSAQVQIVAPEPWTDDNS